ncbi:MAG: thiamine diphosphokinase [Anaerolineaceae bacterium]|nr:thiamine diphosphokinase [Anaerolineaceae bacterium]
MAQHRALVFANGEIESYTAIRQLIEPADMLVAVDGGLRHLEKLGVQPHLLVGDLDSADADAVGALQAKGVKILRFSPEKNETDLELALQTPEVGGARQVLLLAALGGRMDHALANILLLTRPDLLEKDIHLEDGLTKAFFIQSLGVIHGEPGDIVSLLPFNGPVEGVLTQGLKYPLDEETLCAGQARGISNVLLEGRAVIRIRRGLLFCVHTRKKKL